MWEYRRRVMYYETDRMGVVHHANYLRIIEEARLEWIRDNVMCYGEMEKMGLIVPVVSATGNFKAFLRYDDLFAVRVIPTRFTGVRLCFRYEMYNVETGQVCYDGVSEHYFAEEEEYRPISLRRRFPELYQKMNRLLKEYK